jgi:hypothetical protein
MRTPLVILAALAALAACRAPPLKDYAYPKWGFVADFPAPPEVTETAAAPGRPHALLLESKDAGRDFVVSVGEGVRPDVTIDQIGPDYARRAAKAMGGEVGPESYASTGQGVLGREYAITKDGKPFATIRAFVANDRFYEIGAQSLLGPDDPAVKNFLDLFRITSAPPAVPPPPANAAPTNAAPSNAA